MEPTRTDSPTGRPSPSGGDGAAPGGVPVGAARPGGEAPAGTPPETPDERGQRHFGRKMLKGLAVVVGVLLAIVAAAVLYLQTDAGRGKIASVAVGQIQQLLAEGNTVEVDGVEGNFLTGARLIGLVLKMDGEPVVRVDTAAVDYNLLTLANRTLSIDQATIAGPYVLLRQRADSTFNLQHLLEPAAEDPDSAADAGGSPFTIRIADLNVTRGQVLVGFYTGTDRDSVLTIEPLAAEVSDFLYDADNLKGEIDDLSARVVAADGQTRWALSAAGAFSQEALDLARFSLRGDASDVAGSAQLVFATDEDPLQLNADLEAQPLALAEVRAFAPVPLYGSPAFTLRASGGLDEMVATVRASEIGGGTASLNAAFSLHESGPTRIRVEGDVAGIDPSILLNDPARKGEINGTVDADLRGADLQSLSGPFDLHLEGSALAAYVVERADVDGRFTNGRATFDAGLAMPGLRARADGRLDLRDLDRPAYAVDARINQFDLARFTRNPDADGRLAGRVRLEGRGFDIGETAEARVGATLTSAQFGEVTLQRADLDAQLDGERLRYDLDAQLAGGGGRLEAAGSGRPFADPLRLSISTGRLQGLDLAALTGDPAQESDLSGTFSGSVVGTDPQTMALDLTASLQDARYGTYAADALDLTASLRRGLLTLDLDADLGAAGQVAAQGTARPFLQNPSYDLTAALQNVDLSQLLEGGASTDLNGRLVLEGSGFDPQRLAANAQVTLRESRYADQQIDGADLQLSLSGGDLSVTGDVDVPGGGFALDVGGRLFDENPSVVLGPGTEFRNVNLGALLASDQLTTSLNGTAEGRLQGTGGFDPQTLTADLDVVLAESTVNDARIGAGVADVQLGGGRLDLDSRLELGLDETGGRVTLAVGGRLFDEVPTYELDARFAQLDLGAFAGVEADRGASLTGAVRLDGSGLALETADFIGAVALGRGRLGTAALDTLGAQFALADGLLRVDGIDLQSEIVTASGGGQIALTDAAADARTDFRLTADVVSLEPLTPFLETPVAVEQGEMRARVQGRPGRPLSLDLDLSVEQLVYGEIGASGLEIRVLGQYDPRAPESADSTAAVQVAGLPRGVMLRTRLEFDYLDTGTTLAPLQSGDLDLVVADQFTLDGDVVVDNKRDLDLRLRLDPDPEARRVALERMTVALDGTRWQLLQEASIRYGDGYTIRDLLLYSEGADGEPEQQIAIDGTLDPEGMQNLILTIEDVAMGQFADLVGYGDLGGTLSASLLMTGRADRPEIDGTLVVDGFSTRGQTVGSIDVGVTYASEQLELDALLTHVDGERLSAAGFVPLQFQLGPGPNALPSDSAAVAVAGATDGSAEAALVILADAFPIAWAEPLVPPYLVTELGGTLAADVVLGGTQAAPSLSGTMRLSDGRIGLPATGRTFRNISLPLVFEGSQVLVQNARMQDSDGEFLAADGTILLPELSLGELDLTITANEYTVMDTETYDGLKLSTGSRPLRFTGTTELPRLEGAIELAQGDIYNTAELTGAAFEDVTLDPQEVQRVEALFGLRATAADTAASVFYQNLAMDLAIEIDRDVWFRSRATPALDIEFAGSLQAQKAAQSEDLLLFNQIEVVRGNVEFANRRFDITRGRLTFNGPVQATYVDLLAELEIRGLQDNTSPEVTIQLAFTGSLAEEPELTLSSDPQMDNADIVSYIATGRPAAEFFDAGGDVAGQVALSQLAGLVENLAGAGLGLDVVQIETRADGSIIVIVGRYLSERAYLSLGTQVKEPDQRTIGDNEARFEAALEYELLEWLQLRLQQRAEGVGAGLLYELAW